MELKNKLKIGKRKMFKDIDEALNFLNGVEDGQESAGDYDFIEIKFWKEKEL